MYAPPNLPMSDIRMLTAMARLYRLDSLFVYDHFQEVYPTALWDRDFAWAARRVPSPHALFEYQTLLGSLAARAGRMQLGVGVTKPIGRHPVLIAQAALTLAHLTKRAPILGIGTGERMNIEPYGLPGTPCGGPDRGSAADHPPVFHVPRTDRLRGQAFPARAGGDGPRAPAGSDAGDLDRRARAADVGS